MVQNVPTSDVGWPSTYLYSVYHHQKTTTTHSASCPSVSPVSVLVGGRKDITSVSCSGWNHRECKWSLCANGCGRNTTIVSCCQWQPPQAQGAKVRTSISASWNRMQQQPATPTTTTTDQLMISTSVGGGHDVAIIATSIRAGHGRNLFGSCVPLHKLQWLLHRAFHQRRCWSWPGRWWWWLELHVVAASRSDLRWYWSWPLHLVLAVVVTGSNLRWWGPCTQLTLWCYYCTPHWLSSWVESLHWNVGVHSVPLKSCQVVVGQVAPSVNWLFCATFWCVAYDIVHSSIGFSRR